MLEKHSEMKNRKKSKNPKRSTEKTDHFLVFKTLACFGTLHFKPVSSKK